MNVNGILGKYLIFHRLNNLSYLFLVFEVKTIYLENLKHSVEELIK